MSHDCRESDGGTMVKMHVLAQYMVLPEIQQAIINCKETHQLEIKPP
jgi:hypothetical protein